MPHVNVRAAIPEGGVCHNWLEWSRPLRPADSYFLWALLACASAAINRRILVNPGEEPEVFTNLYVVLVGPSGAAKTTAIKRATRLLKDAVVETPVLPTVFTMSGLTEDLDSQSEADGKCGGVAVVQEFARLVGGPEYQLENLGFLTELWDCPNVLTRKTRTHGYEELTNPYLCLLAAMQPEAALKLDPGVLDSGGLRRMLILAEHAPKHWEVRSPTNSVLFNALGQVLKDRLAPSAFGPTLMRLSDEAHEAREVWERDRLTGLRAQASEREMHFISCMDAHALKVAAVLTALETDHPDRMEAGTLRAAQKLLEALLPNQFEFYRSLVPTPYARLKGAILRLLQAAGGWVAAGDFDRMVGDATGADPLEVAKAKCGLETDGRIETGSKGVRLK